MARWTARSSRSKAEYLDWAEVSFWEKKARGRHEPLKRCCKTAPTCEAEASTARETSAEVLGKTRGVAEITEALEAEKAAESVGVHTRVLGEPIRASVRGRRTPAMPGRKRR